jgi:hypothetical protein
MTGTAAAGGTPAATPKTMKMGAGLYSPLETPEARGVTNARAGAVAGTPKALNMRSHTSATSGPAEESKKTGGCSVVKVLMSRWTHPRG